MIGAGFSRGIPASISTMEIDAFFDNARSSFSPGFFPVTVKSVGANSLKIDTPVSLSPTLDWAAHLRRFSRNKTETR
jgi:hypothetical protein